MPTLTDDELRSQGKSWEEARWATLSPIFRANHNRWRIARGMQPIPEPKIDMYVPKKSSTGKAFDPNDKEFIAEVRKFHGGAIPGAWAQGEGFSVNGKQVSFALNDTERKIERKVREVQRLMGDDEGFKINGRAARA